MAPTIVLIPGAWHSKAAVEPLAKRLEVLGHPTQILQLASVNTHGTIGEDAAALGKAVGEIADRGEDILLVPHSFAGAASAPIQKEFAKKYRKQSGKPGGIIGLVYIAAFVTPAGPTLETILGGKLPPWQLVNEEKGIVTVDNPIKTFYGDLPAEVAQHYVSLLGHQSLTSLRSPTGDAGYKDPAFDGRRAYIQCNNDGALPPMKQQLMREKSGVAWDLKNMQTSHTPFLSKPDEVAEFLVAKSKQYSW